MPQKKAKKPGPGDSHPAEPNITHDWQERLAHMLEAAPAITSGEAEKLAQSRGIALPRDWYDEAFHSNHLLSHEARWFARSAIDGFAAISRNRLLDVQEDALRLRDCVLADYELEHGAGSSTRDGLASGAYLSIYPISKVARTEFDNWIDDGHRTPCDYVPDFLRIENHMLLFDARAPATKAATPTKAEVLAERDRMLRLLLADQIEETHEWDEIRMPLVDVARVALLTGIDSDVHSWEEAQNFLRPQAWVAELVMGSLADVLRGRGVRTDALPPFDLIATWCAIDLESLKIHTERKHPMPEGVGQ